MVEARRRSQRHGDGIAGPGGHSENLKAQSFLRGSWRLCTPSLPDQSNIYLHLKDIFKKPLQCLDFFISQLEFNIYNNTKYMHCIERTKILKNQSHPFH